VAAIGQREVPQAVVALGCDHFGIGAQRAAALP